MKKNAPAAKALQRGRKKTILILDDHPMMREGLALLIGQETDLAVAAHAESAHQAMDAIAASRPDLVLADISLPDKNGLEFLKDVQAMHTGLAVLVISMHDEAIYAERVLRAGGRGYVMKQEGGKKIMEAIRAVLGGKIHVSEKISARILEVFSGKGASTPSSPVEQLTDREFEVFQLIGEGKATKEIAAKLHISVKTVEVHRANIKAKLKLVTAPELIRHAVRWIEAQNPS